MAVMVSLPSVSELSTIPSYVSPLLVCNTVHLHVSTRSWFVCSRFPLYNFGKLYNLRFNGQHLRFHLFRLVFSTRLLHHHYYYYFPRSKYQYIHSSVAWISVRGMGRSVVGLLQGMRGRQTRARGRIFLIFNGKSIENIKNSMEI